MKQSNSQNTTIAQVQQTVEQLTDNSGMGQLKDKITEKLDNWNNRKLRPLYVAVPDRNEELFRF